MKRIKRAIAAATLGLATAAALGQMSMDAPTPSAPAPETAPAAVTPPVPATQPATATAPSAANVLENLLKEKPGSTGSSASTAVPPPPGGVTAAAVPALPNVTPAASSTSRVREGQFIWQRTGRLDKDEKTGNWYFAFDADGNNMQDPPMELIPSKFLMAMEDATGNGTLPLRFKVSGQVTEYRGKNFLWVQQMEILRDVNKGIGG